MNLQEFNEINQYLNELTEVLKLENDGDKSRLVEILNKLKNSALPSAIFTIILNLVSSAIGDKIGI